MTLPTFALLTPDCLQAALAHQVAGQFAAILGSAPEHRFQCALTPTMVKELYAEFFADGRASGEETGASRDLVLELFASGQCEVLVWPTEFHTSLLRAKGATHPADAAPESIRGSYPVDNAVCNLVHVSDTEVAAARELRILTGAVRMPSGQETGSSPPLAPASGVLALCEVLGLLPTVLPSARMPAREAFTRAADALIAAQRRDAMAAAAVNRYFHGDPRPALDLLTPRRPDAWRRFVLRCGAASAIRWQGLLLERVVAHLCDELNATRVGDWVVGGSAAALYHGDRRVPGDIDVRCSEQALDLICRHFGVHPAIEICGNYRSRAASICLCGWTVDFSADLVFDDGRRVRVDGSMVRRRDLLGYQAREDLLAEMISLRRPAPKYDLARANGLLSQWLDLDYGYLQHRLAHQGESPNRFFWRFV